MIFSVRFGDGQDRVGAVGMRRTRFWRPLNAWTRCCLAVAAFAAGMLLSGSVALAAGPCGNDFDQNSACAVNSPYSATGSYSAANEQDYYVFHATVNTQVNWTVADNESVTACGVDVNPYCGSVQATLYDSQGDQLDQTGETSPTGMADIPPQSASYVINATGTYYLVVNGSPGTDSAGSLRAIPYTLSVSASPAVVWPYVPPTSTPPPTGKPVPPAPHWIGCRNWRYNPRRAISNVRGLNISCGQIRTAVNQTRFTGGARWVKLSGRWGLRGGVGPGHYGIRMSGFACHTLDEWQIVKARKHETVGMNVSCSAPGRRFGFVWASLS